MIVAGRDTFENWQSEFLQLIWQVVGLAYFLYAGSNRARAVTMVLERRFATPSIRLAAKFRCRWHAYWIASIVGFSASVR